ncbi:PREDICTED: uncharacterized protein LOC107071412 [Polistes dominula]|uniref:Uncharacterized protein LOC107071412 n=1 Tax=Polistes dominula TaxID=743375 RepID=A0ABM1J095_POLDO|nr:PREDICTED: uncharacterized protein LOC107071412 [Polistes dominula]
MSIPTESVCLASTMIELFDPENTEILYWLNDFEFLLKLLNIPRDKAIECLLNLMETSAFLSIQQKVAPADPYNLSYEELINHLEELFGCYQGETAGDYRFELRDQYIGESVLEYKNALIELSRRGSFFLRDDSSILLRLIPGLIDKDITILLDCIIGLTLDQAMSIASKEEWNKMTHYSE